MKDWLHESTSLHIDGIKFNRHSSGLEMRVDYRDPKGFTHNKRLVAPDTNDYTDMAVEMSDWLEVSVFGRRRLVPGARNGH